MAGHSFGMKDYLEWKLQVYGAGLSGSVKSLLEDFFLGGVFWAEGKLEFPLAFYQWLEYKKEMSLDVKSSR